MKFDCEIDVSLHFTASRIRYEITSGNIGGAFAVKNMTGAIYVAGALDYETRKRVSCYEKNIDGEEEQKSSLFLFPYFHICPCFVNFDKIAEIRIKMFALTSLELLIFYFTDYPLLI